MTRRAFVVGHPIGHSRSPLIHGHWLALHDIDGSYEPLDMAPENFAAFVAGMADAGYCGGNVTLPHKEAAFRLVGRRDAAAEAIGAVNTLWLEGATVCGANTDAYGFAAHLDSEAPEWAAAGHAVVLGAGGAARAIVHALTDRGVARVSVVNRTAARAEALAAASGGSVCGHAWGALPALLPEAGLLVNTTSLGMHGQPPLEIDLGRLPEKAIVCDIVYVPLTTQLLAAAARRGLRTVDGLGMLLHQAVPGFERWFGIRPAVTTELRALVARDIGALL